MNTDGVDTYRLRGQAGRMLDPATTAALVIDPVNDFLSEDGAAWDRTSSSSPTSSVPGAGGDRGGRGGSAS